MCASVLAFAVCTVCVFHACVEGEGVSLRLFVRVCLCARFPDRLLGVGAVTTPGFISERH